MYAFFDVNLCKSEVLQVIVSQLGYRILEGRFIMKLCNVTNVEFQTLVGLRKRVLLFKFMNPHMHFL